MSVASFSRVMTVDEARRQCDPIVIIADEAQCRAVAERFGWIAVHRLSATLRVDGNADEFAVVGQVTASVAQACIASGQPVQEQIDMPFDVRMIPAPLLEAADEDTDRELDQGALDTIGYHDDRFDLADLVAETLALAVNPWPRSDEADVWLARHGVIGEDAAGPFGALAALRETMKKG